MTPNEIADVLRELEFQGWDFILGGATWNEADYLQVSFTADGATQHGRKWRLSPWMTKSEVVQTAFAAVLAAVEHEAREHFLYRGQPVFGPHFDVDALWTAAFRHQLDVRPAVAS